MTTSFNFSRFMQLMRKQWVENSRMYFFAILALLALQALTFTFMIVAGGPDYSEDAMYVVFITGLFISGSVFASISFSMLGDKTKGAYWLAFPASHVEKLLCMILYSSLFFTAIYCIFFFVLRSAAMAFIFDLVASNPTKYSFRKLANAHEFRYMFSFLIYGFFGVQALYLLGSVYFPRYSFILTSIIGTAIIFIFLYVSDRLSMVILPKPYIWNGTYASLYDSSAGGMAIVRNYSVSPLVLSIVVGIIKYSWAPVFWLVAWHRLKEKQI